MLRWSAERNISGLKASPSITFSPVFLTIFFILQVSQLRRRKLNVKTKLFMSRGEREPHLRFCKHQCFGYKLKITQWGSNSPWDVGVHEDQGGARGNREEVPRQLRPPNLSAGLLLQVRCQPVLTSHAAGRTPRAAVQGPRHPTGDMRSSQKKPFLLDVRVACLVVMARQG